MDLNHGGPSLSPPQVKWKDLITDLNLTPSNLNPERVDEDASLPFPLRIAKAVMPTDEVGGGRGHVPLTVPSLIPVSLPFPLRIAKAVMPTDEVGVMAGDCAYPTLFHTIPVLVNQTRPPVLCRSRSTVAFSRHTTVCDSR